MIAVRKGEDRGATKLGWLDSKHSFSFGDYFDADFMGFGPLRVINEDRVKGGAGFPTHGHRDMEIISYVIDGALEHKDTIGEGSVIRPGDVQRMSAGSGVHHSEYNADSDHDVHFLQIWIEPDRLGLQPSYEQKTISAIEGDGAFRLIGSPDGRDGSVTIHQDVDLYLAKLDEGGLLEFETRVDRLYWLQVVKGTAEVAGERLAAGDGLSLMQAGPLKISSEDGLELLLFDMTPGA